MSTITQIFRVRKIIRSITSGRDATGKPEVDAALLSTASQLAAIVCVNKAQADIDNSNQIAYWGVRGIGSDWNLPCLVTGKVHDLMANISGFADSPEGAEAIYQMFGGRAVVDYRESEPGHLQVKVGVTEEQKDVLTRLYRGVISNNGYVTARIIKWAVDPENYGGYKPFGYAIFEKEEQ
jgi:hypothetical protein